MLVNNPPDKSEFLKVIRNNLGYSSEKLCLINCALASDNGSYDAEVVGLIKSIAARFPGHLRTRGLEIEKWPSSHSLKLIRNAMARYHDLRIGGGIHAVTTAVIPLCRVEDILVNAVAMYLAAALIDEEALIPAYADSSFPGQN